MLLIGCQPTIEKRVSLKGCINGVSQKPLDENFKFPGTLLFTARDDTKIYALDGETHKVSTVFDNVSISEPVQMSPLSPNGRWIVISQPQLTTQKKVLFQLLSNQVATEVKTALVNTIDHQVTRWYQESWVNDTLIQGFLDPGEDGKITLLDPFKENWVIPLEVFHIQNSAPGTGISVSPDQSRILYINNQYHLVLYDVIREQPLWNYEDYDSINPSAFSNDLRGAVWSNDGMMLALPIGSKNNDRAGILIMNKAGEKISYSATGFRPFGLSWSKQQDFIAFYENHCTESNCLDISIPVIRLYRVNDGLIQDLCILPNNIVPSGNISSERILWSPNEQFVAYGHWNSSSNENGITIQKLDDGIVRFFKIEKKDLIFLGWSEFEWSRLPGTK